MTENEPSAAKRMQRAIEDAHLDALRHPDPCGSELLMLAQAVEKHVREETVSVETYIRLAHETHDPVVAVVMELLVEEEQRHHALFERIATTLEARLGWATESLPTAEVEPDPESGRLVHGLEDDELRSSRALRQLAHRARHAGDGLVSLLLEAMAMDSEKHAHLLRFVSDRLSSPPR